MADEIAALQAWQLDPETNRAVMQMHLDNYFTDPQFIALEKVISVLMREDHD